MESGPKYKKENKTFTQSFHLETITFNILSLILQSTTSVSVGIPFFKNNFCIIPLTQYNIL